MDLKNDPNGSLKNFKTQDQDGLGTCYANSLSVMLESWTGKPISYHQIATAHGLDQFFLSKAKNKEGQFFTEGGDSCQAFKALRKRNKKLCQKKDVLFDNLINSNNQEIYLKKIGEFYDSLQGLNSSDAKEIITFIKNASRNAKQERIEECQDLNHLQNEAEAGLNELAEKIHINFLTLYDLYQDMTQKIQYPKEVLEYFEEYRKQALYIGEFKGSKDNELFILSEDAKKKVDEILLDLKTKSYSLKTIEEKNQFFEEMILKLLGENTPFKNNFKEILKISENLGSEEDFKDLIVDPILSYSNPDYCLSKEHKRLFNTYLNDDLSCTEGIDPKIAELVSEISTVLSDNYDDLKYNDGFFEQLENSNQDMESFFMGLINKSCDESGIKIPEDAQCHFVSMPHRVGVFDKILKSKEEIKKLEKEKTLSMINSLASQHLQADIKGSNLRGRALVVDVCSGFLSKKNVSYNWPKTDQEEDCNYNGKHAYHSMAIIGMRCFEGKIQYKIQNSWGTRCDNSYSSEIQKHCDPKDGSFWVDENTVADNVTGISLMSRDKAHYGESF